MSKSNLWNWKKPDSKWKMKFGLNVFWRFFLGLTLQYRVTKLEYKGKTAGCDLKYTIAAAKSCCN